MNIATCSDSNELGRLAAALSASLIRAAIKRKGEARIVLSTGASQFTFFSHFIHEDVPWDKVEVFHLDEYVGLPLSHPASFRKYIRERFLAYCDVRAFHPVDGEGDVEATIRDLSSEIAKKEVDLALIGIGENGHIAFNDPPADFEDTHPYKVVNLDHRCKAQQVGEGWFPTEKEVPDRAITMTPYQIMRSAAIVSCVPGAVKADAIAQTLSRDLTPMVPATLLKQHPDWHLLLDQESSSAIGRSIS